MSTESTTENAVNSDSIRENPTEVTAIDVESDDVIKAGIFYSEPDLEIVNRVHQKIQEAGYEVELCNFYDSGQSKMETVNSFIESKHIIFWVATDNSLKNDPLCKAMANIAHHAAITSGRGKLRFVTLLPKDGGKLKLPPVFSAYTPLSEDSWFEPKLAKTLSSIKKDRRHTTLASSRTAAPCTTAEDAVASSGCIQNEGHVHGQGETTNSAIQEPQAGGEPQVVDVPSIQTNVFNVHVYGRDNLIQIGSDNQIVTSHQTPPVDGPPQN